LGPLGTVPTKGAPWPSRPAQPLMGSECNYRLMVHRDMLIRDYYQVRLHAGELQPAI